MALWLQGMELVQAMGDCQVLALPGHWVPQLLLQPLLRACFLGSACPVQSPQELSRKKELFACVRVARIVA